MKKTLTFLSLISFIVAANAQQVGVGTTSPAASAQLDVNSTNKGFLPPRMTTAQRDSIHKPADGLVIFNISANCLQLNNNTGWHSLSTPTASAVNMPTIVIGTQQWMNRNLEVAFYRNGDTIPRVDDKNTWATLTTGAWCFWNNDSIRGVRDGKLYNWYAVNDPRGLAPQGWHIPSDAEWTILANSLGGASVAGIKMKTPTDTIWYSPGNTGGNNSSGFTAMPGGIRFSDGTFQSYGFEASWWSSTEGINGTVRYCSVVYFNSGLSNSSTLKRWGFFVRCIRD